MEFQIWRHQRQSQRERDRGGGCIAADGTGGATEGGDDLLAVVADWRRAGGGGGAAAEGGDAAAQVVAVWAEQRGWFQRARAWANVDLGFQCLIWSLTN